jgi:hypothetical protein
MRFSFGSHLPMLIKAVQLTTGPIVEFGCGVNSTVFLHWACHNNNRPLLTLEGDWEYYKEFRRLRCDYHQVEYVKEWNDTIASGKWSVVLIDHHPKVKGDAGETRSNDAIRFADSKYVIIHDPEHYDYSKVYPHFKYRYDYTKTTPNTVVLSNIHELSEFK